MKMAQIVNLYEIVGFYGDCNSYDETIAIFNNLQKAKNFLTRNFKAIEEDKINFYSSSCCITTNQAKVKKIANIFKIFYIVRVKENITSL